MALDVSFGYRTSSYTVGRHDRFHHGIFCGRGRRIGGLSCRYCDAAFDLSLCGIRNRRRCCCRTVSWQWKSKRCLQKFRAAYWLFRSVLIGCYGSFNHLERHHIESLIWGDHSRSEKICRHLLDDYRFLDSCHCSV